MLSEFEQEQRPSGNGDREAFRSQAVELSGSCVKDVQFIPDIPDMIIRTWCLETIPFELIALDQSRT